MISSKKWRRKGEVGEEEKNRRRGWRRVEKRQA